MSTYQYDVAGNRTLETYATSAGTYEHATVVWDALNRMVSDTDTCPFRKPHLRVFRL